MSFDLSEFLTEGLINSVNLTTVDTSFADQTQPDGTYALFSEYKALYY